MIRDLNPQALVDALAQELRAKKMVHAPEWSNFVKTGVSKQKPPLKDDWWYMRSASILRAVSVKGPIGVSKLRTKYGGKQNRGYKPERFKKGSGKIVRLALQQLEEAELLKQVNINGRKGREITKKGKDLMKAVAADLSKKSKG